MTCPKLYAGLAGLASLSILALVAPAMSGDDRPSLPAVDSSQAVAKAATKLVLAEPVAGNPTQPTGTFTEASFAPKGSIERPTKNLVETRSGAAPTADELTNPKVKPGLITWHPTFADACQAAQKSGKPVLLFQLMGKLDNQFC